MLRDMVIFPPLIKMIYIYKFYPNEDNLKSWWNVRINYVKAVCNKS